MIIVEPFDFNIVFPFSLPLTGPAPRLSVNNGAPLANLLSADPRELYVSGAGYPAQFYIDLGVDTAWDTISLINTNGVSTAIWSASCGTDAQAGYFASEPLPLSALRVPSEDVASINGPALFWSSAPIVSRYIYFYVTQPAGSAPISIGRLVIGKSWRPTWPREPGAGRPSIDTGGRERLPDGGLATVAGSLVSGFRWTFGDLTDADLAKLWGIWRRRRTTEPVLIVEDPAAPVAEGIHYGTFTALDAYERSIVSKSRWSLSMEDWTGG
jgi:hypothetical protein